MTKKITMERELAASPEEVWEALTTPEALTEWLMHGKFTATEGADFEFRESGLEVRGRVLEAVHQHKLKLLWTSFRDDEGPAGTPSVLTWTLSPKDGGGTRLAMEHELLEAAPLAVTIENEVNWAYTIHCLLPTYLVRRRLHPVPIVYMSDAEAVCVPQLRRAGFRQESETKA